jgi:1-acyl-sn-glycerol-3-phosphate acyltransferase
VHDTPTRSRDRLPLLLAIPYTVYAVLLFLAVALVALVLILPLPSLQWRRRVVHTAARIGLAVVGMRFDLRNPQRLPQTPCIVVANHASYLDGVVLKAALPARFGFVIKREMNDVPLAGLLLRRIGAQFVDRGRGQRGARDARRVLKIASTGASLVFFPEGTFEREPGLLRFHSGAFVTAVRNGYPVVPLVIRGTRRLLPPHFLWPRPGRVELELLEPLASAGEGAEADATMLRDRSRELILARLGEPDRFRDGPP